MGVPESSVRWVAAEHENAVNSKHVHVLAWSSDGSFSSVMPKHRLERARAMMTDAALAPAMKVALDERDIAHSATVDAARSIPAEEVRVKLPPTGHISYAHLRRWHPETAAQLMEKLTRAGETRPEVAEAASRSRAAVERCAELKGLEGDGRVRYVRDAMADLDARRANAALRTIAPDRTEAPMESPMRAAAPTDGPATRRLAERRMRAEVAACVPRRELEAAARAVRERRPVPKGVLERLPSYRSAVGLASSAAGRAALRVLATAANPNRRRDLGDEAGEAAARILTKAALAALRAALVAGGSGAEINRNIVKEIRI